MKAVVIGSTLQGFSKAAQWRQECMDVTMLASGTYLLEEWTETWRGYPLCMQTEMRGQLKAFARQWQLPEPEAGVLTPAQVKRLGLQWARALGIRVRYLTRPMGVTCSGSYLTGVLAADQRGVFHLPCLMAYDAVLYGGGTAAAAGRPICFTAGAEAVFRFELTDSECTEDVVLPDGTELLKGAMDDGHVFVQKRCTLPKKMTYLQLRKQHTSWVVQTLRELPREDERFANAQPGSAMPLAIEVSSYCPSSFTLKGWNDGVGLDAKPQEMQVYGIRMPWNEKNGRPLIAMEAFPQQKTDVCVVGMGTGGVWAALAAQRSGARVTGVEMMPYMGGTRTLGGVVGRYYGNRSPLFFQMVKEITGFAKPLMPQGASLIGNISAEMLYYASAVSEMQMLLCTLACAVEVKDGILRCVLTMGEDGVKVISAEQFIDAAGDGGLASLCGCTYDVGDDVCGVMQNYSQWNRCSSSVMGVRSIDQDTMDDTQTEEWSRALEKNLLNAKQYDLFDLLTVRESRRMHGRLKLTMQDVARERHYADVLCEAYSTHDPHGRCMDLFGRLGMMPALGRARFVSIPLRAVTFDKLRNLMVAGKAISCDQNAFNFIRMSADVASLGWAEGRIAAACAIEGVMPCTLPLDAVQQEMYGLGALTYTPPERDEDTVSPLRLATGILNENQRAYHEALLTGYEQVPKLVSSALHAMGAAPGNLASRFLVFWGQQEWAETLNRRLKALDERCGTLVYSDHQNYDGVSRCGMVDDRPDDYWEMNQLAVLLAYTGYEPAKETLRYMMEHTIPGGDWINDASNYARIRLDCQTIPNFDRIFCLSECAVLLPCEDYIAPLRALDEMLAETKVFDSSFYKELLQFKLTCARMACGDEAATFRRNKLMESEYSTIRRNAAALQAKQSFLKK